MYNRTGLFPQGSQFAEQQAMLHAPDAYFKGRADNAQWKFKQGALDQANSPDGIFNRLNEQSVAGGHGQLNRQEYDQNAGAQSAVGGASGAYQAEKTATAQGQWQGLRGQDLVGKLGPVLDSIAAAPTQEAKDFLIKKHGITPDVLDEFKKVQPMLPHGGLQSPGGALAQRLMGESEQDYNLRMKRQGTADSLYPKK
jgi:hypothetical protein